MTNVKTLHAKTEDDFKKLDRIIDSLTKEVVESVKGSKDFVITTACFIDDEFVLVSEYDINESFYNSLKKAALAI